MRLGRIFLLALCLLSVSGFIYCGVLSLEMPNSSSQIDYYHIDSEDIDDQIIYHLENKSILHESPKVIYPDNLPELSTTINSPMAINTNGMQVYDTPEVNYHVYEAHEELLDNFKDGLCYTSEINGAFKKEGYIMYDLDNKNDDLLAFKIDSSLAQLMDCEGDISLQYTFDDGTKSSAEWENFRSDEYILLNDPENLFLRVSFEGDGESTPIMRGPLDVDLFDESDFYDEGLVVLNEGTYELDLGEYIDSDYLDLFNYFLSGLDISLEDNGYISCTQTGDYEFSCQVKDFSLSFEEDLDFEIYYQDTSLLSFPLTFKFSGTPDLHPVTFNTSTIDLAVTEGQTTNLDLVPFLEDLDDDLGDYNLFVSSVPSSLNCYVLSNQYLRCYVLDLEKRSSILELSVTDLLHQETDTKTVTYEINYLAKPPIVTTPENDTLIGSDLSKTFTLSSLVSDADTPLNELLFSYDSENSDLSCSLQNSIVTCTFATDETQSTELEFIFSDLEHNISSDVFEINHLEESDLSLLIGSNDTIHDVYSEADFTYNLQLSNPLIGFDLYNLEIGFESDLPAQNITYNPSEEEVDVLDYDGDTYNYTFNISLPEINNPASYNLFLTINDFVVEKQFNLEEETFYSVPLTKDFAADYLDVDVYIPGTRPDGQNDRVPVGVKLAVPYTITSSFDVPVEVYVCEVSQYYSGYEELMNLYEFDGDTYANVGSKMLCENTTISSNLEDELYISHGPVDPDGWLMPTVFLDINPSLERGLLNDYYSYKEESETFLVDDKLSLLAEIKGDDPAFYLSSEITSPAPLSVLSINTTYSLESNFNNHYAFDVVDVDACAQVFEYDAGEYTFSLSNQYGEVLGDDCKTIERIGYRGSGDNVEQENFSFRTNNMTTSKSTVFGLFTGYFVDAEFSPKGGAGYNIE